MRNAILILLLGAAALSLWARRAEDPAHETIVLTGSSTMAPLMAAIGKRFEESHPGVRVDVHTGGSSRGIADVREAVATMGMVSRALEPSESDLFAVPIAHDGVCLIVHRDNPVRALEREQIRAIYTGRIERWSAVGGRDAPITVVHKSAAHSTLRVFLHHFGLRNEQVQPDVVVGDNEQAIKTVAGNPDAIGYVSIGTASHDAAHGVPIRLLPLAGIEPTVENVRTGRYPLRRPLLLVTRGRPEGAAKALVELARSSRCTDLVRRHGFVPLAP